MFWNQPRVETQLDRLITDLELDIQMTMDDPKASKKKASLLSDLYAIRLKNEKKGVDANTVVICLTNVLGIALILWWEHGHVIASRAINHLVKPH